MTDEQKRQKAELKLNSGRARNVWLGTVRADGSPHLVPLWFAYQDGRVWMCVGKGTQKHVNLIRNPNVVVALEDAVSPVIIEGVAREEPDQKVRDRLAPPFIVKYDWDFRTDTDEDWVLVSVEPGKILAW